MNEQQLSVPRWVWWKKGECVIEVIKRGHYPATIMGKLPDDSIVEIELSDIEFKDIKHGANTK